MNDSIVSIDINQCIDCAEKAINKDFGGFIACAVTIVFGVVVRFIEKRKDRKKYLGK